MGKQLFDEFNPVTTKQWKQKIQFDLNGQDYNDTLVYTSDEGIKIKPFYNADDVKHIPKLQLSNTGSFKTCETIFVANEAVSNKRALSALAAGIDSLKFIIPNDSISPKELLKNITLDNSSFFFDIQFLSSAYCNKLQNVTSQISNIKSSFITTDVIGNLAKSGNWYISFKKDFSQLQKCIYTTKTCAINVSLYQNAGANIVQQLAYALAHTNEYFNTIENTMKQDKTFNINVVYNVSVGSNYFFEIAKLKALKILFNTLKSTYTVNYNCHIFVTPTTRNKTIYSYNSNISRSTTECLSGILGGANTINTIAHDNSFRKYNQFSNTIARHQLLLFKHDGYFKTVTNATDGSYYIESLTHQLAERALTIFKNIEKQGGFLKQLKQGVIQKKIIESAEKEQTKINAKQSVIVGSNKYCNPKEKMKNQIEIYPFTKIKKRKTLITPIIEKRLTENLEQQRLKKEE